MSRTRAELVASERASLVSFMFCAATSESCLARCLLGIEIDAFGRKSLQLGAMHVTPARAQTEPARSGASRYENHLHPSNDIKTLHHTDRTSIPTYDCSLCRRCPVCSATARQQALRTSARPRATRPAASRRASRYRPILGLGIAYGGELCRVSIFAHKNSSCSGSPTSQCILCSVHCRLLAV